MAYWRENDGDTIVIRRTADRERIRSTPEAELDLEEDGQSETFSGVVAPMLRMSQYWDYSPAVRTLNSRSAGPKNRGTQRRKARRRQSLVSIIFFHDYHFTALRSFRDRLSFIIVADFLAESALAIADPTTKDALFLFFFFVLLFEIVRRRSVLFSRRASLHKKRKHEDENGGRRIRILF